MADETSHRRSSARAEGAKVDLEADEIHVTQSGGEGKQQAKAEPETSTRGGTQAQAGQETSTRGGGTQAQAEQEMTGTQGGTQAQAEQEVAPPGQGGEVATRDAPDQGLPQPVDPYKTVYSPWELPANTVAAADWSTKVEVDPELMLSDERMSQAKTAIADYQDSVAEVVGAIPEDPRLGGGAATFDEWNAERAQHQADREQARAERLGQDRTEAKAPGEQVEREGRGGRQEARQEEKGQAKQEEKGQAKQEEKAGSRH